MKFKIDHDLHIHTYLSACSSDPEQNPNRILDYAEEYGLRTVAVADHFWDREVKNGPPVWGPYDYDLIKKSLPLPKREGIRFLFGGETDMSHERVIGVGSSAMEEMDFIIVPTTHMHFIGETVTREQVETPLLRAETWMGRLEAVLSARLPFRKTGIAHLACTLLASDPKDKDTYFETLSLLPEEGMRDLFRRAASLGVGIELNFSEFADSEADLILRPFRIAKKEGCKFYYGSDAHHPARFPQGIKTCEKVVELLGLTESDKFRI